MADLILSLLESQKFNERLFKLLDKKEQDLTILLMSKAGLHSYIKDITTKRHNDISQLLVATKENDYKIHNKLPKETLDRWDIVKGEIMAGNDNRLLVKEAINLVNTFITVGHVSREEGQEQINMLKNLI